MNTAQLSASPQLPLSRFQFVFHFEGSNLLPVYSGSAWRGAFGTALKQTVCVVRNSPCQQCMLKQSCAYPYIFETPPPENATKMRLYTAAPHPFVIHLSSNNQANPGEFKLGLTLFGQGYRYLPYMIHAFSKAGKQGLGSRKQIFDLSRVDQITEDSSVSIYQNSLLTQPAAPQTTRVPECPPSITIHLETPLRIKQDGKNCNETRLSFPSFFGSLLRRHSMLTYFHTDTPLETNFSGLMQQARNIRLVDQQLSWHDWTRYSSRQQTKMNMGGLIGSFSLHGDLQNFWPYLWLGQWTHTGKGTSMGLGAYRIEAASLPTMKMDYF